MPLALAVPVQTTLPPAKSAPTAGTLPTVAGVVLPPCTSTIPVEPPVVGFDALNRTRVLPSAVAVRVGAFGTVYALFVPDPVA